MPQCLRRVGTRTDPDRVSPYGERMQLKLAPVTPENVGAACRLAVRPDQEKFVAPVAVSLAEAYAQPDTAWPRLVYDGEELVGFVMGGFDPDNDVWFFR